MGSSLVEAREVDIFHDGYVGNKQQRVFTYTGKGIVGPGRRAVAIVLRFHDGSVHGWRSPQTERDGSLRRVRRSTTRYHRQTRRGSKR